MRCDIIAFGEVLWDIIEGVPNLGGGWVASKMGAIPKEDEVAETGGKE